MLSVRKRQYATKKFCKKQLSDKIRINMREFKKGTILKNGRPITSRKQAIAISYSQIKKMYPKCFKHIQKI